MAKVQDGQRNPVSLNARVPLELYRELQDVADQLGVALSVVVREALEQGLGRAATSIENQIEDARPSGSAKR